MLRLGLLRALTSRAQTPILPMRGRRTVSISNPSGTRTLENNGGVVPSASLALLAPVLALKRRGCLLDERPGREIQAGDRLSSGFARWC